MDAIQSQLHDKEWRGEGERTLLMFDMVYPFQFVISNICFVGLRLKIDGGEASKLWKASTTMEEFFVLVKNNIEHDLKSGDQVMHG